MRSDVLAELWGRLPADRLLRIIEQMNLPAQDPEFGSAVATALSAAASQARIDLPSLVDWLGTLDFRDGAGFGDDWQQATEAAAILAARSDDVDDAQWTILARLAHGWLDRTGDLFAWYGTQVRDLPVDQRRRLASAILQRYPDAYTVHNLGRESRLAFDDREWWLSQTAAELPAGSRPSHLPSATVSQEAAPAPKEEEAKRQDTGRFDLQRLTSAIEASDWPEAARELHLPVDRHRWHQGAPLTRAPAWLALGAATKDAATELATAYVIHLPAEPTAELMNAAADALTVGDRTGWARLNPDVLVEWLKAASASRFYDQAVDALVQAVSGTRHEEVEALLLERIAQDDARRSPLHLQRLGGFNSPKIARVVSHHDGRGVQRHVSQGVRAHRGTRRGHQRGRSGVRRVDRQARLPDPGRAFDHGYPYAPGSVRPSQGVSQCPYLAVPAHERRGGTGQQGLLALAENRYRLQDPRRPGTHAEVELSYPVKGVRLKLNRQLVEVHHFQLDTELVAGPLLVVLLRGLLRRPVGDEDRPRWPGTRGIRGVFAQVALELHGPAGFAADKQDDLVVLAEQRAAEGVAVKVAARAGYPKIGEASAQDLDGHPLEQLIVSQRLQRCPRRVVHRPCYPPVMPEPLSRRGDGLPAMLCGHTGSEIVRNTADRVGKRGARDQLEVPAPVGRPLIRVRWNGSG